MLNDDQYMERTPDIAGKIRKMRETAEKEMNRFTRVADYDLRHVVGQKRKAVPDAGKSAVPARADKAASKIPAPARARQSAIEFPSSSLAHDADQEGA